MKTLLEFTEEEKEEFDAFVKSDQRCIIAIGKLNGKGGQEYVRDLLGAFKFFFGTHSRRLVVQAFESTKMQKDTGLGNIVSGAAHIRYEVIDEIKIKQDDFLH